MHLKEELSCIDESRGFKWERGFSPGLLHVYALLVENAGV